MGSNLALVAAGIFGGTWTASGLSHLGALWAGLMPTAAANIQDFLASLTQELESGDLDRLEFPALGRDDRFPECLSGDCSPGRLHGKSDRGNRRRGRSQSRRFIERHLRQRHRINSRLRRPESRLRQA